MAKNKIVGLTGLDTRGLTNFIRDNGLQEELFQMIGMGTLELKIN